MPENTHEHIKQVRPTRPLGASVCGWQWCLRPEQDARVFVMTLTVADCHGTVAEDWIFWLAGCCLIYLTDNNNTVADRSEPITGSSVAVY